MAFAMAVAREAGRRQVRSKHAALVQALTGRFDTHHGAIARVLLNQIDALNAETAGLDGQIEHQLASIVAAEPEPVTAEPQVSGAATTGGQAVQWLCEVTGTGVLTAKVIVAEIGIDMTRFPSAVLRIWCRGPSCRRAPCSPVRSPTVAEPVRATPF